MKNITKIIKLAKPLYYLITIIAFLIFFAAILELVAPILSKFIIDDIVLRIKGTNDNFNNLIFLISLTFILSFLGVVLSSLSDRLGDHFQGKLRQFLTELFYEKVLSLPQSYFDSEISGKIVNQLNRGIFTIYGFVNTATNFILPTLLQSIFTIIVMAYYNIWVAFFTFLLFPVYMVISYFSTKKWGEEEVKKNKIEDYSRGRISEVIGNIKLVKSFNNEKNEWNIISKSLSEINKIYARQSTNFHIFDFLRNFSLVVIITIINIIVFYSTFKGSLSIGGMVLILQLLSQARRPLFAMSFILSNLQAAESGSKEFMEILSLSSAEIYTSHIGSITKIDHANLEFKHIYFKYEKSDEILNDISFKVAMNETVALVGHSGVGKTTIVNLILKLYKPISGKILMNGKDYITLDHAFIRNNIALVFQENELFSTTIRENVAYGHLHATDEEIMIALKKANAYDFVLKLPHGLNSEVGERGVRLSGGQKQRIQIARAILKNAPILILDEATSSLDSKSEREVQEALENLMKNKLVIIIAHRFSTIQNVDSIVVLDKGKIVDSGNPIELSKRKGVYSELLQYQLQGNKKLLEQFEIVS
ncbi:MAG: ABC transporter ATP-binding protein [bacterium]|nr:ABC transporter ATP-binding protein [bacterium]